jgi:hypothetical protein
MILGSLIICLSEATSIVPDIQSRQIVQIADYNFNPFLSYYQLRGARAADDAVRHQYGIPGRVQVWEDQVGKYRH